MNVKRGEIYVVDLIEKTTKGHEIGKKRPGLIIQSDYWNETIYTTIIIPLTSHLPNDQTLIRVVLSEGEAGLNKKSNVLFSQIRSVDKSRLGPLIGQVSPALMEEVDQALSLTLGLTPLD